MASPTDHAGQPPWPAKRPLLGVDVTCAEMPEVLDCLFRAADAGIPASVEHLAVYNLMLAVRNPTFAEVLSRFRLVTADGQPIRLALNALHGAELRDRVTARELMLALCGRAEKEGYAVYLYGDEAHVIAALCKRLEEQFPTLRIVGREPSLFRPLSAEERSALLERIRASGAAFVFVALGCPLQELFVSDNSGRLGAIQLCVGSAFKILAGERSAAPKLMQAMSLEWLYRLAQDPRRLFWRYASTNAAFLGLIALQWARQMGRTPPPLSARKTE